MFRQIPVHPLFERLNLLFFVVKTRAVDPHFVFCLAALKILKEIILNNFREKTIFFLKSTFF